VTGRLASLSTTVKAGLLAGGCVAVLALAFALGRATAPAPEGGPSLVSVASSQGGLSLPHLSQALPVPALAAAPVAKAAPARVPITPVIHRKKATKPGGPVDIVGSG
jgi:hypothetical protein